MELSKRISRAGVLLCIVQMCLLMLASVSPQIHLWVFHDGYCAAVSSLEKHPDLDESLCTSEDHESQPYVPDDTNGFCPVILFAKGITCTGGSAVLLLDCCPTVAIEAGSGRGWSRRLATGVHARAPPTLG